MAVLKKGGTGTDAFNKAFINLVFAEGESTIIVLYPIVHFCKQSQVPAGATTTVDVSSLIYSGTAYGKTDGLELWIYTADNDDFTSQDNRMGSYFLMVDSYGLTSLDLSNFNTSNVTDMESMFTSWSDSLETSHLTSLNVSSFDTSKVTNISDMFSNLYKLNSLNITNFDTSSVVHTGMQNVFGGCASLTSLDLSNFKVTNEIDYMGTMFYNCSGLTSLDLRNFDVSNVTSMYAMFTNCSNLEHIYVSESWYPTKTTKVTNSNNMFYGCSKLPSFSSSTITVTKAKLSTEGGYFTYKAPVTKKVYYGNTEKTVYFGNTRVYYK